VLKKAQVENGNSTLLPEGDPYVLTKKRWGWGSDKKKKEREGSK
jgi:hypothetical protein